ncbi:hypothetical protein [Pigmentiphaga litoralis]|uniref:hypothetical protein n=1 Tax=Pigmentiphaga litoralis TaxID=516702 RepID=UPI003B433899
MAMSLQSLVQTFEVTLRNRIHVSLSRQASMAMGEPSSSVAWYDHKAGWMVLHGETFEKVEKILCANSGLRLAVLPTPDRVVASLSFGVWPNMLDSQLPTPAIEATTFVDVFPAHPKVRQHWRFQPNRKETVAVVKDVQNWRNRLSHCKPVWSEGWFRSSPAQHWTDMLQRLTARRQRILQVMAWMCPQTAQVHIHGFQGRLFDQLVQDAAVFAYVSQPLAPWSEAGPISDNAGLALYKQRR